MFAGGQQDGRSQLKRIGRFARQRLAKLCVTFAAPHKWGTRLHTQSSVSRAIDKHAGVDAKPILGALTIGDRPFNPPRVAWCKFDARHGRVEEQGKIGFGATFLVENQIEHGGRPLWIAYGGLEPDLFDDATFAGFGAEWLAAIKAPGAVGAHNMHPYFTGRVAAEHRAVLAQNHMGATAGRRDRTGNARRAAASNQDVAGQFMNFNRHASLLESNALRLCLNPAEVHVRGEVEDAAIVAPANIGNSFAGDDATEQLSGG